MYNDTNFFVNLDKISNNNYTYGKLKQKQKQKPKTRKPITAENHQGGNTNEIYYTLVVMIYDCIHSDKEETHRHMILLAQYLPMRSGYAICTTSIKFIVTYRKRHRFAIATAIES